MTNPRTTVLMPAHNRADVIGHAIRSVLWQTDPDFELLIAGDGCTDGTAAIVAAFEDPRIRWFDLPKAPFAGYANRNRVLREARGRYVAYAQDDDIMLPDHLERLVATLERTAADWAYSRPVWVGRDGSLCPFPVDLTQADQLDFFLNRRNTIPSCCVAHRREVLEGVGHWPEDVERSGDWVLWKAIIGSSADRAVGFCREPTVLHFRARGKDRGTTPEEKMRAIAAAGAWWPETARIPVVDGVAEQASAFAAIARDPVRWTDDLRRDVDAIIDRLAWAWLLPEMNAWSPPAALPAAKPPATPPKPPPVPRDTQTLRKARRRIGKLRRAKARHRENWESPRALARRLWSLLVGRRRRRS